MITLEREPAVALAPVSSRLEPLVVLDPLQLPAWDAMVGAHPDASVFHRVAWARVLHETYGHRPAYIGRFADGRLEELLPIMEVASAVTGRRGVSLPFTDFSPPLIPTNREPWELYEAAMRVGCERGWRYLQWRGGNGEWPGASPSLTFYGHILDLEPGEKALFKGLDGAVRRGIRKAEKEGLWIDFSGHLQDMRIFYRLHCRTRRRHGLPPQPRRFFDKIAHHVFWGAQGFVAVARLGERPVAAAVFLRHGRHALYKFGASDYGFQHLRPNNLLMWKSISRCAAEGLSTLHFGRTSLSNEGLRRFKLGFGAREELIQYYRYDFGKRDFVKDVDRTEGWFNKVFRCLPAPLLRLAGELLYPHLS